MGSKDIADVGQAGILVLLGTVLSMFSGFLFRLVGARYLTTDQFGLVVLGISLVNIASLPCLFGLNQGVVRFIAAEKNGQYRDTYITVSILTVVALGGIAGFLGLLFKDTIKNELFGSATPDLLLYIFLCTIPIFALLKLIGGILRGEMNSKGFVRISKIIRPGLKLILAGVAVFVFGTSTSVAVAFFVSTLFTTSAGLYLVWAEGWRPQIIQSAKITQLYRFSLPLLISSSIFILLSYLDKMLIAYYQGPDHVAIYEVAVTIVSLLGLFRSAFGFLLYPKLTEQLADGNEAIIAPMYQQTTKWILGLTTPAFAALALRPDFLIFLFGEQYEVAEIKPLLVLLGLGLFLNAVTGPNGEAMLGFGRSKSVLIYNTIAVSINFVLNIVLIPKYGLVGAATASLLGYTAMNILKSIDLYLMHNILVVSIESVLMSVVSFTVVTFGLILFHLTFIW
ncbi:flippase [Natrinema sp. SYSU A 869]|uniref:flippase n=1 Tax=Natrinema sp. SYSU A 869 TaxID=2871694 RepID=UPI001CA3B9EE|nr:flippase [Natrinema sp. SYSU A 869]